VIPQPPKQPFRGGQSGARPKADKVDVQHLEETSEWITSLESKGAQENWGGVLRRNLEGSKRADFTPSGGICRGELKKDSFLTYYLKQEDRDESPESMWDTRNMTKGRGEKRTILLCPKNTFACRN